MQAVTNSKRCVFLVYIFLPFKYYIFLPFKYFLFPVSFLFVHYYSKKKQKKQAPNSLGVALTTSLQPQTKSPVQSPVQNPESSPVQNPESSLDLRREFTHAQDFLFKIAAQSARMRGFSSQFLAEIEGQVE